MAYLLVEDEPTVELTGSLDANDRLQVSHSSGILSNYDDELQAEDEGATIRIKLMDFVDGASTWVLNASHPGSAGPISWNRSTDHAYFVFAEYMANFLGVTITATGGDEPKEKAIDVKIKPDGALPDCDL